jgi:hypothetical protein
LPSRDPGRLALLASGVVLGALLFVGLLLIELLVDAPSRSTARRLAAATVLAIAAYRLRALVHLGVARQPRSSFDLAGARGAGPGPERSRLQQLYDELRLGARDRWYFDTVLWPRLCALAEARTGEPAHWLPKPPTRSFGRGPSPDALRRLVAAIETRR